MITPGSASTTSANLPQTPVRTVMRVVAVAGAFAASGTSAYAHDRVIPNVILPTATTAGGSVWSSPASPSESTAQAITTFRRLSGLTWDQIAQVFAVSRRAVHFWASGQALSAEHEDHLRRSLALVRDHSGGADRVRDALRSVVDGQPVLARLTAGQFDEAQRLLTAALGPPAPAARPRLSLSPEAQAARRPLPPEVLAAGEEDASPLPFTGQGRRVNTSRSRGRGES